jgi:gas vesicle protein
MYERMDTPHPNGSSSFAMFLIGAAVGATVGVMCAPASGRETRAQLANKANQLKDKASEFKDKAVGMAEEWTAKASDIAQDTLDRTARKVKRANDSIGFNDPGRFDQIDQPASI